MKSEIIRVGVTAAAVALLAPAAASAHPNVYTVTAKVGTSTDEAQLTNQLRYAVNNDGYAYALRETNGVGTGGMVNYALMPSGAFRNSLTKQQKLQRSTGVQPHATCDTPALTGTADDGPILAWQGADPFYAYIPFQPASAGFGDDPAKWIPIVRAKTGVDLTGLTTTAQLQSACQSLPGGVFHPADEVQTSAANFVSAYVASIVDPLNAQITGLQTSLTAAQQAKADAESRATAAEQRATDAEQRASSAEGRIAGAEQRAATAEAAAAAATARGDGLAKTLQVSAASSIKRKTLAGSGLAVTVDGPPQFKVTVRLLVSASRAKALKLKSRTLGSVVGTTGDYSLPLTLKLSSKAAKAIKKSKAKKFSATLEGRASDRISTATISLKP